MLYLVEDFLSFQGEGKYIGKPSIFLRFGGCNLTCSGFDSLSHDKTKKQPYGCDSFYAVDKKEFLHVWQKYNDYKEIVDKIKAHMQNIDYLPDIVITGGEPLLYCNNKVFYELVGYLIEFGFKINIETNTTIKIDFDKYPFYKNIVYAMGVKLSNSGEEYKKRVNKEAIYSICTNSKESFFKFVISEDMISNNLAKKEIEDITCDFKTHQIFCMPMGESIEELSKNDKIVAKFCIDNGYTYSDRIHIRLWNDKRGV